MRSRISQGQKQLLSIQGISVPSRLLQGNTPHYYKGVLPCERFSRRNTERMAFLIS